MRFLAYFILLLPVAAEAQDTRAGMEELLLKGNIVGERMVQRVRRITLDDGTRQHDAAVETEDGTTPTRRNYRFNVAAYEMDKALELNLVAPAVERIVKGRPASVTWWADDVAMAEVDRRRKKIEPPVAEIWNKQMQAVRIFDELVSNPYRSMSSPTSCADGPPADDSWGELLIRRDWRVWLIDHTGTFRTCQQLEHRQSLTRCDRTLLRKLRELNQEALRQKLGKYLSREQLLALEIRRELLVKHFEEQIDSKGERAVLYE